MALVLVMAAFTVMVLLDTSVRLLALVVLMAEVTVRSPVFWVVLPMTILPAVMRPSSAAEMPSV